jgi:hypothetical protein
MRKMKKSQVFQQYFVIFQYFLGFQQAATGLLCSAEIMLA